jgi:hypothetical protein
MNDPDLQAIRERAAAEERAAILEIIERHARQFAHGHGITGGQALQHIADEVRRRDDVGASESD